MASEQQFLSLSDDEYEVIESGVDSTYRSIDAALNDSLVLHPMFVSTMTFVDENDQSTITNEQETGLFNSSTISSDSSHSSDAITAMLRSQWETMSLMEKQIQEFTIIQESFKDSNSLQFEVNELSMKNGRLEQELDETRTQLMSVTMINESIEYDVREEVIDEICKKDSIISSLTQQIVALEQARRDTVQSEDAPSLDEMVQLLAEVASIQQKNAHLSNQLSEEHAKRMHEKKLRKTLERSLDSISLTGSIRVEDQQVTRAIQELMAMSDEVEQQNNKIRELESELANYKTEKESNVELISILQEEKAEGARILAEHGWKIDSMKRTLEKYGHFSDF